MKKYTTDLNANNIDQKEMWVNVYECNLSPMLYSGNMIYDSKEKAVEFSKEAKAKCIGTFKLVRK